MPHVQITWVEGRTPEMKRKIADRITAVLIECLAYGVGVELGHAIDSFEPILRYPDVYLHLNNAGKGPKFFL